MKRKLLAFMLLTLMFMSTAAPTMAFGKGGFGSGAAGHGIIPLIPEKPGAPEKPETPVLPVPDAPAPEGKGDSRGVEYLTFYIRDQDGNSVKLEGDAAVYRYKNSSSSTPVLLEFKADELPKEGSLQVNEPTKDYYYFRFEGDKFPEGYAPPGSVKFVLRTGGEIKNLKGENIFENNKVWLEVYKTDHTATLSVQDKDHPGAEVPGVELEVRTGAHKKNIDSVRGYYDFMSGDKPVKIGLWPEEEGSDQYWNLVHVRNLPAGYKVVSDYLADPDNAMVFRHKSGGAGGYSIELRLKEADGFFPNPDGKKIMIWLERKGVEVKVWVRDGDNQAVGGVPLYIQRWDGSGYINYPVYAEDLESDHMAPLKLELEDGQYKISQGSDPMPSVFFWKRDVEIRVNKAEQKVEIKDPASGNWEKADNNEVNVIVDKGFAVTVDKKDGKGELFLQQSAPGFDGNRVAEFKLFKLGSGEQEPVPGSEHSTKDQNPWNFIIKEPGDYLIKETKAPREYNAAGDFSFRLKDDGKIFEIKNDGAEGNELERIALVNSAKPKHKADVEKVDENGAPFIEEGQPGYDSGKTAAFELYYWDSAAKLWTKIEGTAHDTKDKNPWSYDLVEGDYKLRETRAPAGYKKCDDFAFRVKVNGDIYSIKESGGDGDKLNKIVLKNILIPEYPVRFSVIEKGDAEQKEIAGLDAGVLKIPAAPAADWKTDGNIKTLALKPGEYMFYAAAGAGGYAEKAPHFFKVDDEGKVENGTQDAADPGVITWTPTNDDLVRLELEKGTEIKFSKIDVQNPGEELGNAELSVKIGPSHSVEWTSGALKTIRLADGEYSYREDKAPAGYDGGSDVCFRVEGDKIFIKDLDKKEFLLTGDTLTLVNVSDMSGYGWHRLGINAREAGSKGTSLPGAQLRLLRKNGSGFDPLPGHGFVSGDAPRQLELLEGQYRLESVSPPAGYEDLIGYTEFKVGRDGAVQYYGSENEGDPLDWIELPDRVVNIDFKKGEPKPVTVKVQKVDENDKLFPTEGSAGYTPQKTAEFELLTFDSGVVNWVTVPGSRHNTKDGNPWEYKLLPGDYKLSETSVPFGYITAIDYVFRVKNDGTIVMVYDGAEGEDITASGLTVKNELAPAHPVRFSVIEKGDAEEKEIAGARLDLYDHEDNSLIEEWFSEGSIKIRSLPEGTYELMFMGGGGYAWTEPILFKVNSEGHVELGRKTTPVTWTDTKDNLVRFELMKGVLVKFTKIDVEDPEHELAEAELRVEEVPDGFFAQWFSDGGGMEWVLEEDKDYEFSEITPPDGYAGGPLIKFTLKDGKVLRQDGSGVGYTMLSNTLALENVKEDKDSWYEVLLNAKDKSGIPVSLAGAQLSVERRVGSAFVPIPGHAFVSKNFEYKDLLTAGHYRLVSVMPPPGYHDVDGYTEFKIDDKGKFEYKDNANDVWVVTAKKLVNILFEKNDPDHINVNVEKVWDDENNKDGKRPESVIVELLVNGAGTEKLAELNEANFWRASFANLEKTDLGTGEPIEYSVMEHEIGEGYGASVTGNAEEGFTVTNTRKTSKIDVNITKVWDDKDDRDGKRPDSVRIKLLADGADTHNWIDIKKADGWKGKSEQIDEYKDGKKIVYTMEEEPIGDGYSASVTGSAEDGFTVTNKREPNKIDIDVLKAWKDSDDKEKKRPDSVTVKLYADGKDTGEKLEIKKADGWKGSFKKLYEFKGGKKIVYTIKEESVKSYKTKISGDPEKGFTVTNIYKPPIIGGGPKTGDAGSAFIWAGALLLSAATAAALALYDRRKRAKKQKQ